MTTLVIGYGNEARGDDGAGPAVAKAIDALKESDPEVSASFISNSTFV